MPTVTSTLQINLVDDVSANAKHVAAALEAAQKQTLALEAALAKSGTSDRLQGNLKKIGASASHIDGVSRAWKDFAKTQGLAEKASEWTKAQKASVKSWESVSVSAIRAIKSEEISLARMRSEQASQAVRDADREAQGRIAAMRRESQVAQQEAHRRQEAISQGGIAHYAAGAVAGAVSAHGIIYAAEKTMKAGETLEHALAMMRITGVKQEEVNRVLAAARAASKAVPTSTDAENINMVVETKNAFGKVEEALDNLQFLAKTTSILKDVSGDKLSASKEQMGYFFTKFFEARGVATNSKTFQAEGNEMNRAMIATRGVFNPYEMYEFSSQAGAKDALRKYSPRFMERILPSIITAQSGATAGTSATAYDRIISGAKISNKQQALAWKSLHLLRRFHEGKGGQISWQPGDVIGTKDNPNLAYTDPDKFNQQLVLSAMKKYWHTNLDDPMAVQNAMKRLYVNQKALGFATEFTNPGDRTRIKNDATNYSEAQGTDEAYGTLLSKNPETGLNAVTQSFDNLKSTLSAPVWEAFGGVWKDIAEYANSITDSAKAHPTVSGSAFVGGTAAGLLGSGYASWYAFKKLGSAFRGGAADTVKGGEGVAAETTTTSMLGRLKAGAGAEASGLAGALGMLPLLSWWLAQGDSIKLKPDQIEALKEQMRRHPEDYKLLGKGTASAPAQPDKSMWQRIFGAGDTGIVPVSFSGDSTTMTSFERAVARGVSDGMMSFATRYSNGGVGGSGGGGGDVIRTSYSGGSGGEGSTFSDIGQGYTSHGRARGSASGMAAAAARAHASAARSHTSRHGRAIPNDGSALRGQGQPGRGGFTGEGRARIASWLSFFQRPVDQGGLGMNRDKSEAMVAMMQGESGMNLNPGKEYWDVNGPSGGTAAWHDRAGHHERLSKLKDFAAAQNKDWRDPVVQQGFFRKEALGSHRAVYNAIMGARDAEGALTAGVAGFEVPANIPGETRKRLGNLRRLQADRDKFKSDAPPVASDDPLGLRSKKATTIPRDYRNEIQTMNDLSIAPDVDHSGVLTLIGHLKTAHALAQGINGRGSTSGTIAGLGSRLRGGFAHSGSDFG